MTRRSPVFSAAEGGAIVCKIPLPVLMSLREKEHIVTEQIQLALQQSAIFKQLSPLECKVASCLGVTLTLELGDTFDFGASNLQHSDFVHLVADGNVQVVTASSSTGTSKRYHHTSKHNNLIGLENLFRSCDDRVKLHAEGGRAVIYRLPIAMLLLYTGIRNRICKAASTHLSTAQASKKSAKTLLQVPNPSIIVPEEASLRSSCSLVLDFTQTNLCSFCCVCVPVELCQW